MFWHRLWKAMGAGLPTVMYVLLHLQVQVLRVSVVGARSLRVAGKAIATIATSVLRKLATSMIPFAGSWTRYGISASHLYPARLRDKLERDGTDHTDE